MLRKRTRRILSFSVCLLIAATLGLALAGGAFAAPGDSPAHATYLNPYFGSSLTTRTAGGSIGGTGAYYFRTYLSSGNTLRANFTALPGLVNLKVLVLPFASGYDYVQSVKVSTDVARLTFMAPVSGMYTIYAAASSTGTFTVAPSIVPRVSYSLSGFTVPLSLKKGRAFDASVKVNPAYDGPLSPIKFVIERKVSGKWKAYSTTTAHVYSNQSTYTKYHASLKISRAGTDRKSVV
jgi:hypothetical protein